MKFLWGLFIGFAMGVAVGLILAPQSGEATLSQLGEQGITLRDRSGSLTDELRSRASGLSQEMRSRATEALDQGRELYSRTKDDLTDRYSKAKSGEF